MNEMLVILGSWQLDVKAVRERMYVRPHRASANAGMPCGSWPAAGQRPRWPRLWSGTPIRSATGLRTCARRVREDWPSSRPGVPPALDAAQQAELKAAVQAAPSAAGLDLANWNWKVVRQFVQERFGRLLSGRSCLNYLHRLGFVLKRPKKRLLKANAEKRAAFVAAYVALRTEAQAKGRQDLLRGRGALPRGCGAASQVGAAR